MLKNLMADSRLDLDAPLLSVRRFASEPDTAHAPPAPGDPNPTRSALPFYKSDLKSGPVTNPGVVPFVWEQSPGQPKPSASVSVLKSTEVAELQPLPSQQQEEEDEFADALETMSRTESYFLNCSEPTEASRSFAAADRDFVMDRFLPAAKAMAREREILDRPNTRVPLSYRYGPYYVRDGNADEDDEGDDCYESNGHFMGKACGLIPNFCFKTSFCLLNPVPGMKVSNRRMAPKRIGSRRQVKGYVGQAEEEYSWEEAYKHRLTQTRSSKGEDRTKITNESDCLVYVSDYRTADGSLPYHRSNCVGVSSNRNEPSQLPFHEGKGFLGVPKRGSKNYKSDSLAAFVEREREREEDYWGVVPICGSIQGSCSMSPTFDRTLHVDSEQMLGTPHSKSSSLDTSSENKVTIQSAGKDSEMGVESRRMEESLVLETCHRDVLQPKLSEPELKISLEISVGGGTDENNGIRLHDGALPLIEEGQVKNGADLLRSLLPPPLPNSPSDSWLSHALPSVSSKNPSAQSFLGIQMHPKKQITNVSPADVKLKASAKPPRLQCGLTRFADMLEKPLSP